MIAVDSSALIAIALGEPQARAIVGVIDRADGLVMSAATVAESLIVARRRDVGEDVTELIEGLAMEIVPVSREFAEAVADAYDRWGKGVHPAGLNFGDCFRYAVAEIRDAPLLYIGEDFRKTDIRSAMDQSE